MSVSAEVNKAAILKDNRLNFNTDESYYLRITFCVTED
jgi:hypothetical protein